ncbi:MAG: Hsp70 family protein, partial [Pseudomonadota bacterium]
MKGETPPSPSSGDLRSIVGIDLGTTNTAIAHTKPIEGAARVKVLETPQLVAPAEVGERPILPSFLYLAGEHDLPATATALPWNPANRLVVGELARSQGARVPSRMVASAKSWLCHAGVDRHAAILPWGVNEGSKLSPVEASARILAHIAASWAHLTGASLSEQEVIITVPASFDEVARELTGEAAAKAGLEQVTLLEEPQAVFYSWIDAHGSQARRQLLDPGDRVLICDVGGGTTDFSILEVGADGDSFERTAVGDHLLLGGDNIDLALACLLEKQLGKLDTVQWHGMVHSCRLAKEMMLSDSSMERRTITVAARGSRLIGGALKCEIRRAELESMVIDGFFPLVGRDEQPTRGRSGLQEFGLPYAADPAITRHLGAFLGRHNIDRVDAVLFNGGAMKPAAIRERVLAQLSAWQEGKRPIELSNAAPELAVARGAAYYGLVRHGLGSRIRGGAGRAYYVGLENDSVVCVVPRGAEEGTQREISQDFIAVMNRPVSFRLFSASARADQPGDIVEQSAEQLVQLPPLVTVLRAPGRADARVKVWARLTEIGTLELWCISSGASAPSDASTSPDGRWRLTFDLRGASPTDLVAEAPPDPNTTEASRLIGAAFSGEDRAPNPASLIKDLEHTLDARRDEWPTATIRALWGAVREHEGGRSRSPDTEARWLNLAGFLLRPGTGAPLDDWRMREMWRVFQSGFKHERDEACRQAWWILWRRIGAGLKRGQQEQLFDRIAPLFLPSAQQKTKWFRLKPSPQETAEMWRTLSSMERLTPAAKTKLGDVLVDKLATSPPKKSSSSPDPELLFWALGRLGARTLLYGPADAV